MAKKNQILPFTGEKKSGQAVPPDARKVAGPLGPGPKPGAPAVEERVLAPGEEPPAPPSGKRDSDPDPVAPRAHMKKRHWIQALSFALFVVVPLAAFGAYLYYLAEDQYASTTGFTVQREEGGSASEFLGLLPGLTGGGSASDTDVLYEFIQSQEIVERIDAKLDLRTHYSQHWDGKLLESDKAFSIWPDATVEDLLWFWKRVVRISYDQSTGLIEVQVLAFDADYAQAVAREVVVESQKTVNALSTAARDDATRYALADLDEAVGRLKDAREALQAYRTRTQIVDPQADLAARLGVMNNLQQQLAQALIDYDLLRDTASTSDPRVSQAERRIQAIKERIISERQTFASDDTSTGAVGVAYPTLIAEFERLSVDLEFAEQAYTAALTALDVARANAARQSRYLATYVEPTLAQSSEYPQRWILFGLATLFMLLAWSIVVLIYYSVRDRR